MENNIKKRILNAEGKRMLEITKLNYSKQILDILKKEPDILDNVLVDMTLPLDDALNYLSGDKNANIVIYDQMLVLTRKKYLEKKYKNR